MKKDDKGFTLLEVLIAVIILAFVIVPLLRSFVSSYNVNAKSRRIMRATTLAQNEMEIFEKEKLEVLLDEETYDYTVDDSTTYVSDEGTNDEMEHVVYKFSRSGIINDETGREMFDVVVILEPESASASDLYYAQNTQDLLFMNTLSGSDSATYVQRIRTVDDSGNSINTNGDDEEVYNMYVNWQHPEGAGGTRWTADMFEEHLERTITVKIEQTNQGGSVTTVAKVNYEYVISDSWNIVPDERKTYKTKDKVLFNNAQLQDDEGNPIELQSVYLFYAPRYKTTNPDNIVIENRDNLPVNIYIIRQNILDETNKKVGVYTNDAGTVEYSTELRTYTAAIEIYDGFNEDGKTYGNYFTNLNFDPAYNYDRGTTNITLHDSDGVWTSNGVDAIEKAKFKSLGATEAKDRIYTMDVSVYNHGDDPAADEPLVRLTGSKIE